LTILEARYDADRYQYEGSFKQLAWLITE